MVDGTDVDVSKKNWRGGLCSPVMNSEWSAPAKVEPVENSTSISPCDLGVLEGMKEQALWIKLYSYSSGLLQ